MPSKRLTITLDPRSLERLERWAPNEGERAKFMREGLALAALYREIRKGGGRMLLEEGRDKSLSQVVLP